jgi:hypothetical protein
MNRACSGHPAGQYQEKTGKKSPRSSQMAKSPSQPQQGGSNGQTQQQQGQQSGGSTQQAGQPIFKDWASI